MKEWPYAKEIPVDIGDALRYIESTGLNIEMFHSFYGKRWTFVVSNPTKEGFCGSGRHESLTLAIQMAWKDAQIGFVVHE